MHILALQASPLERVLADELEQHLEPLETSREVGPDGWIGVFNHMLINLWHRLKYVPQPDPFAVQAVKLWLIVAAHSQLHYLTLHESACVNASRVLD